MKHISPIERACQLMGGISSLARALQIQPPTVHEWITGKRAIPIDRCIQIEMVTLGSVRCEELRPDKTKLFDYLRSTDPRFRPSPSAPEEGARGANEAGGAVLAG